MEGVGTLESMKGFESSEGLECLVRLEWIGSSERLESFGRATNETLECLEGFIRNHIWKIFLAKNIYANMAHELYKEYIYI